MYRQTGEATALKRLLRNTQLFLTREATSSVQAISVLDYVFGWDISNWQPVIDWSKVPAHLKYVYIKSTEGTSYLSRTYEDQFFRAGMIGQLRGTYHYHHTDISGKAQAQWFLSHSHKGELPACIDVEDGESLPENSNTAMKTAAAQSVYEFVDTVANAWGQRLVTYTGGWFWNRLASYARNISQLTDYFGATYRTLDDLGPYLSSGWDKWTLWQYTSKGRISGITDYVDLSVFHGNLTEFNSWAKSNIPNPPPPPPEFPYFAKVNNPIYGMYVRTQPWYPAPYATPKWIPYGFDLVIYDEVNGWGKMQFGWVNLKYTRKV